MLGQTLSRTAEWQTQLLLDRIVESPESLPGGVRAVLAENLLAAMLGLEVASPRGAAEPATSLAPLTSASRRATQPAS